MGQGVDPGPCVGALLGMPQEMRNFLKKHGATKPLLDERIQVFEATLFGLSLQQPAAQWRQAIVSCAQNIGEITQILELLGKTGTATLDDLPGVLEYLRLLRDEVNTSELDSDSTSWLVETIDHLAAGLSRYWFAGHEGLRGVVLAVALRLYDLDISKKQDPTIRRFACLVRDLGVNPLAAGIWTIALPHLAWIPQSPPELSRCFVPPVNALPVAPKVQALNTGPSPASDPQDTVLSHGFPGEDAGHSGAVDH